ncbi:methionine synthase [Acrasis kona]|uniref:Methionine synthase n=1 Tax=Acrasis kona TaxID=1008807 RepID=A0AAW2ZMC0_9EUKA
MELSSPTTELELQGDDTLVGVQSPAVLESGTPVVESVHRTTSLRWRVVFATMCLFLVAGQTVCLAYHGVQLNTMLQNPNIFSDEDSYSLSLATYAIMVTFSALSVILGLSGLLLQFMGRRAITVLLHGLFAFLLLVFAVAEIAGCCVIIGAAAVNSTVYVVPTIILVIITFVIFFSITVSRMVIMHKENKLNPSDIM